MIYYWESYWGFQKVNKLIPVKKRNNLSMPSTGSKIFLNSQNGDTSVISTVVRSENEKIMKRILSQKSTY